MIRRVKFNNFYSFKKTQEISFLANKKKTYDYFSSKSDDQITKVAAFVGGNASGKTNVMRLFSFLAYFVCTAYRNESSPDFRIAYKTFFNNKRSSNFSLEFEKDEILFFYDFEIKENIVKSEKLSVKLIEKGAQKKKVFTRDLNLVSSNKVYFDASAMSLLKNIRSDVSLISYLRANYNIDIINTIYDYFDDFNSNVNERGELNRDAFKQKAIKMYQLDDELKQLAEKFVCDFDLGLSGFEFGEKIDSDKDKDKLGVKVYGLHEGKTKLDFNYESRGTRQLIFSLAGMLYALKHGGVVVVDEIEAGLHPEAVNKLISYFTDENRNGQAQLIFSSHSLGFMNKLDMHQINLVEKDKNNESISYRLNQIEGVRSDDNFLSKYMAGSYGAFPKIRV